jgi:N-acetylmuramoyl-L-alanine amidase
VVGAPPTVSTNDGQGGGIPLTSEAPIAVVRAAYLNVRSGPGPNYAVLGAVGLGDRLAIVGRTDDRSWYQVETPFGTGWVYAPYVSAQNEYGGAPITTASAAEAAVTGPIGIVNTGALHIRSGPGVQYSSLGTLAGGTETQIIGRTADWSWWLLDTPVGTGWANAIYIIARGDISSVPYVAPGTAVQASPGVAGGTAPEPAMTGPVAFVATGALNIRSGPNNTFPSLGSVLAGTRMPIVGQSKDRGWWLVESPYGNGWVSKLYVLVNGDASGVPVQ